MMTTLKTINNLINSARRDRLASCNAIQVLLDDLKDKSYSYNYKIDEIRCLSHLFFIHLKAIELAHFYSNIAVIDCTYNLNVSSAKDIR